MAVDFVPHGTQNLAWPWPHCNPNPGLSQPVDFQPCRCVATAPPRLQNVHSLSTIPREIVKTWVMMTRTMWKHLPPKRSMTQSRKRQMFEGVLVAPDRYNIDHSVHSCISEEDMTTRSSTAPSCGSFTSQSLTKTMWLVRKTAGGGDCIVCSMACSPGHIVQCHGHPSPHSSCMKRKTTVI